MWLYLKQLNPQKVISIYLLFVVLVVSSCNEAAHNGGVQVVSTQDVQALLADNTVQRVDIRTPKEFAAGAISGFQNINFLAPSFNAAIQKLNPQQPILIYCQLGGRSALCAQKLKEAGFKTIYDYKGGMAAWTQAGLKVVTP
ncbi:rhodanese-like domain-containing protein [Bizionia sediminis]|uniref:Rhodanese-like domain-containing protein n=1 Tax=Bizionia sediminis TaxID=1737064 RepID=A0ABW5KPQ3_9FLAO